MRLRSFTHWLGPVARSSAFFQTLFIAGLFFSGSADLSAGVAPGTYLGSIDNPQSIPWYTGFSRSLAVDGNTLAVGVPFGSDEDVSECGFVHLFDLKSRTFLRTIYSQHPILSGEFGSSVALTGGVLVAGAPGEADSYSDQGRASVWNALTGESLGELTDPAPGVFRRFGSSMCLSGTGVLVGNSQPDGSDFSVHGFTVGGTQVTTITQPAADFDENFGERIASRKKDLFIGGTHLDAGKVYRYTNGATTPTFTYINPATEHQNQNTSGSRYGLSGLACSKAGLLAVANSFYDDNTTMVESGRVYIYNTRKGGRTSGGPDGFVREIINPQPRRDDRFGSCLCFTASGKLVIGAPGTEGTAKPGHVYVYNPKSGEKLLTINDPLVGQGGGGPGVNVDQGREFGIQIVSVGKIILVSANADISDGVHRGKVHIFQGL